MWFLGWGDTALYFRAILLDEAFDFGSDDEPVGDVPARRLRRPNDLDDLPPLETVVSGHRIASLGGQSKRKIAGLKYHISFNVFSTLQRGANCRRVLM